MKRQNKGITLIALVITVILLIILAGITIGMTVGENGIIMKAKQARENTIQAGKDEEEELNRLWSELENAGGNTGDDPSGEDANDKSMAEAKHILEGYKAYSRGKLLIGIMPNRRSVEEKLNAGEIYTIPEGYHDGTGRVIANSLASQTPGTATADNITEGKTAWVNGELIVGTGKDNNSHYDQGSSDSLKHIYENTASQQTFSDVVVSSSANRNSQNNRNNLNTTYEIPLLPNKILYAVQFDLSEYCAKGSGYCGGETSIVATLKTVEGQVLGSGQLGSSGESPETTSRVLVDLFTVDFSTAGSHLLLSLTGYAYAYSSSESSAWGSSSIKCRNIIAKYK